LDTYTHGHQEAVVAHHAARTVENSANFLIPYLDPGSDVLDVGCGPGSITVELAQRVNPGRVVGVDVSTKVLQVAQKRADRLGVQNVAFRRASAYDLSLLDGAFEVVYGHQLLQHLADPVRALIEMRRTLKRKGVLGVRDADYGGMVWAPQHPMMDRWLELYHEVTAKNGSEADAGRHLLGWLQAAGCRDIVVTTSTWTYADPESRRWWGLGWARRVLESSFARQAVDYGLSDRSELEAISEAWRWWSTQPNGFFVVVHADAIGHK